MAPGVEGQLTSLPDHRCEAWAHSQVIVKVG